MKYIYSINEMFDDDDVRFWDKKHLKGHNSYKKDDIVRFWDKNHFTGGENFIFKIDLVDLSDVPYYLIGINNTVSTWTVESEIELVPDYELDAMKYNL